MWTAPRWLTHSPGSRELSSCAPTWRPEELHAPTLLDFEVVSRLRGLTLGGHLSMARAGDLLTHFDDLPVQRWPIVDGLRRRTLQLHDNVSPYDAAYVALAEALECPLLTRDQRLARSSGHATHIEVR